MELCVLCLIINWMRLLFPLHTVGAFYFRRTLNPLESKGRFGALFCKNLQNGPESTSNAGFWTSKTPFSDLSGRFGGDAKGSIFGG